MRLGWTALAVGAGIVTCDCGGTTGAVVGTTPGSPVGVGTTGRLAGLMKFCTRPAFCVVSQVVNAFCWADE